MVPLSLGNNLPMKILYCDVTIFKTLLVNFCKLNYAIHNTSETKMARKKQRFTYQTDLQRLLRADGVRIATSDMQENLFTWQLRQSIIYNFEAENRKY